MHYEVCSVLVCSIVGARVWMDVKKGRVKTRAECARMKEEAQENQNNHFILYRSFIHAK